MLIKPATQQDKLDYLYALCAKITSLPEFNSDMGGGIFIYTDATKTVALWVCPAWEQYVGDQDFPDDNIVEIGFIADLGNGFEPDLQIPSKVFVLTYDIELDLANYLRIVKSVIKEFNHV